MSIYFNSDRQSDVLTVTITGYFDNRLSLEFRQLYEDQPAPRKVYIDFRHTDSIDSCGLGILIAMRKRFNLDKENCRLIHCNKAMKKFLTIVHFEKLFTIEYTDEYSRD